MCECPECQPVPARETAVSAAETDLNELPDLVERLNAWQQWKKTGHSHDLLTEAITAVEALRERVAEMERICVTVSDKNEELHGKIQAAEALVS